MTSVAVVIVSHNSAEWLPACLDSVVAHAGAVELDLIVVDSGSDDSTPEVVDARPPARLVRCDNHGFSYANNQGAATTMAPWVLFLNPDTEIVEGTLSELVSAAERFRDAGIFGVRQLGADGALQPSMRRFPTPTRWFFEALGSERWGAGRRAWMGERVLDRARYDSAGPCDWTSGSAMLVRAAVLRAMGGMDSSFFLYFEEPDLSLRASRAGWGTVYLPDFTVVHYGGNESSSPRLAAQLAFAQKQYMEKHFSRVQRVLGTAGLSLGYALRAVSGRRRASSRAALATILGRRGSPFQMEGDLSRAT